MTAWNLFPYPTLAEGSNGDGVQLEDGSLVAAPSVCRECPTIECRNDVSAKVSEFCECRFGVNYIRLDDRRLIVGIVVPELPSATKRAKRRARREEEIRVPRKQVERAIAAADALGPGVVANFERSKQELLQDLKNNPDMYSALARQLKEEFQDTLSQSHDFLQLVKLVKGYAETLLQEKFPQLSVEDAAERLPVEGAIYFSTQLMLLKVDALVYLHEINRAYGAEKTFQIHPFILKYCRIYRWQADQKNLDLHLIGECRGWYRYNNDAIGAVLQGLLDNLVKYAPAGSEASIRFAEDANRVVISFTSLGPRIEDGEVQQIFLPGFRARAARTVGSSGLGLGLATAKEISDALGLDLRVHQSSVEDSKYRNRFETTFNITLKHSAGN